jgi:hypothetical protein
VRCVAGQLSARACEHVCLEERGCARCVPGELACEDDRTATACDADGAVLTRQTCDASERCRGGRCLDLCGAAAARADYVGCEYWAVPLATPQLAPGFSFAVVLANASDFTAEVVLEGGALAHSLVREVGAGATEVVVLPWIDALSQIGEREHGGRSALVAGGAYRIRSDVPVLATQWSPLEHRLPHARCETASCFSYTNDASLLLPTHSLGRAHTVTSFGLLAFQEASTVVVGRGLFAIAATHEGETTVTVHPSAPLEDPTGARIEVGEARSFTLSQGDVLQLVAATPADDEECAPVGRRRQCSAPSFDPTGTFIEASQRVAVFSGHACAHVPFDRPACDHLEEQLLPDAALGRRYVVGRTIPLHQREAPNLLRVLSVEDGNVVRFEPPIAPELALDRGEHVLIEQSVPVRIEGTGAMSVAQLAVAMEYWPEAPSTEGDPALVLVAPLEQWRSAYVFHVPGSYTSAYASIVAPAGTAVRLDGELVRGGFSALEGYDFYELALDTAARVHRIDADAPLGLTLHGYAPWTSYAHLGGLTVVPLVE